MSNPTIAPLEEGDPAQDHRAFRRALGQFATGVTIVTARVGDILVGITVNSFASVSLDPPLILWSVLRASRSAGPLLSATTFAVNVLSSHQANLSHSFSHGEGSRFSGVGWSNGQLNVPLLDGVVATLECETERHFDGGDHIIILGRVRRFARYPGDALLFAQGRYAVARDHPDAGPEGRAHTQSTPSGEPSLLRLLFAAQYRCSQAFEMHRRAEGLSLIQTRILLDLPLTGSVTATEIAMTSYLTDQAAEDGVNELVSMGYAARNSEGGYRLTEPGRARQDAVRVRRAVFEGEQWAGLSSSEISTVKRFLLSIANKQALSRSAR